MPTLWASSFGFAKESSMANKQDREGFKFLGGLKYAGPDQSISTCGRRVSGKATAFTVTGQGLRIEGNQAEFDRLILILGEWLSP